MSYMAMHMKVRRARGRASSYLCACGKQAREWAYNNGSANEVVDEQGRRYSMELSDYTPMCWRCHRLYDKASITHCPHGHPYSGQNLLIDAGKRKCRTCVYERNRRRPLSSASKAKKADYQRRTRAAKRAAR